MFGGQLGRLSFFYGMLQGKMADAGLLFRKGESRAAEYREECS